MILLLVSGIMIALFLILLLLGKKKKGRHDLFLGVMLGLYALSTIGAYIELHNHTNDFPHPHFINLAWLLLFLHGPALWLYIKTLTRPDFRFRPLYLLHLLPFLFFLAVHYLTFIKLPAAEKIEIALSESFKAELFYKFSVLSIGISTLSYNIWALLLIRNHRQRLMQSFSKIENLDLNWLRLLIIAALVVYAINVMLFNLNSIFDFATYRTLIMVTYSIGAVYILFLGYFGLQQGNIFISHEPPAAKPAATNEGKSAVIPQKPEHLSFINKLTHFMEARQPYLDPELTLAKLSEMLKVKPEFLSEVINAALNQNFFDFVNKYRIEEFKIQRLKESNRHLSILGLAYDCGFNSKASFYRAFKKFEGISPTAYIQQVSN